MGPAPGWAVHRTPHPAPYRADAPATGNDDCGGENLPPHRARGGCLGPASTGDRRRPRLPSASTKVPSPDPIRSPRSHRTDKSVRVAAPKRGGFNLDQWGRRGTCLRHRRALRGPPAATADCPAGSVPSIACQLRGMGESIIKVVMRSLVAMCGVALAVGASSGAAVATDGKPTDQSSAITDRGSSDYHSPLGDAAVIAPMAFPSGCGITVNSPHPSWDNDNQIHTRITSACSVLPLISNYVSAKSYRSRWYGWQQVSLTKPSGYAPPGYVQNFRFTAAHLCTYGTWYRYRTEGFGTISTGSQTFTAQAYEQNDDEIMCGENN